MHGYLLTVEFSVTVTSKASFYIKKKGVIWIESKDEDLLSLRIVLLYN